MIRGTQKCHTLSETQKRARAYKTKAAQYYFESFPQRDGARTK
jgi:hypothetical protein